MQTFFPVLLGLSGMSLLAARSGSRVLLRCLQVVSMVVVLLLWYTLMVPHLSGSMGLFVWIWPAVIVMINLTRWRTIEDRLIRQAQGHQFFLQVILLALAAWFLSSFPVKG